MKQGMKSSSKWKGLCGTEQEDGRMLTVALQVHCTRVPSSSMYLKLPAINPLDVDNWKKITSLKLFPLIYLLLQASSLKIFVFYLRPESRQRWRRKHISILRK